MALERFRVACNHTVMSADSRTRSSVVSVVGSPARRLGHAQSFTAVALEAERSSPAEPDAGVAAPSVFVVDDDSAMRESAVLLFRSHGLQVATYATAEAFLQSYQPCQPGCLLLDVLMPGMGGLELQEQSRVGQMLPPVIVVTGHGDVPTAVRAMKNGAFDFIEKPYAVPALLNTIHRAIEWDAEMRRHRAETAADGARVRLLTPREREVLQLLAIGCSLKESASRLGRSVNTLNRHTSNLMRKLGIHSRVELVHLAIRAGLVDLSTAEPSVPHPLGVCQCCPQAGAS